MIDIYTDGSCIGNPGPGGWAAIIIENGATRTLRGRDKRTTNNKLEVLAAIEGIKATPPGADMCVHSDSTYLVNTMTKNWKRNKNRDLWNRLDTEVAKRNVNWNWVRGHSGHPLNEMADRIANAEARGEQVDNPSSPSQTPHPRHSREGGNPSSSIRPSPAGEPEPSASSQLSHVDASGKAQMVDVGPKAATERVAVVTGSVLMQPDTLKLIEANDIEKGDVLGVARIAGIMAAKNTAQLIPLCHPLPLDHVTVEFRLDHERSAVDIRGTARTTAKTGVEMEAMAAVSVAALTIYDMCKAVDRGIRITDIRLRRKSGGKSGDIVLE